MEVKNENEFDSDDDHDSMKNFFQIDIKKQSNLKNLNVESKEVNNHINFIRLKKKLKIFSFDNNFFFKVNYKKNIFKYINFLKEYTFTHVYEYKNNKFYKIPIYKSIERIKFNRMYSTVKILKTPIEIKQTFSIKKYKYFKDLFLFNCFIITDHGSKIPNINKLNKFKNYILQNPGKTVYYYKYKNIYDLLLFFKNSNDITIFKYKNCIAFHFGSSVILDKCYKI